MRIENIHFKNIGVFDDELIEFEPTGKDNQAEIHIITGPNGSGKSTILYGLASVFDFFEKGHEKHTSNHFYKRFRQFTGYWNDSADILESPTRQPISELDVTFDNDKPVKVYGCQQCQSIHSIIYPVEEKYYTRAIDLMPKGIVPPPSIREIRYYQQEIPKANRPNNPFEFAAFAYSGYRYVESLKVHGAKEFNDNPLRQSLEFVKKWDKNSDEYNINQWIANNISKRSISKDKNDEKAHQRYAKTIHDLENMLGEILGQRIEFEVGLDPLNLYVKTENTLLDFDVLPDGMRSLISWIADLMMRLDELKWIDDTPIFERRLFLFLDEIEVHLHPKWQRNVLPIVQKLFKNAQIFITTHSPFVVNSVDNAWIHPIRLEGNKAIMGKAFRSKSGFSYPYILREVFDIRERFGVGVETKLSDFYESLEEFLKTANYENYENKLKKLNKIGNHLRKQSLELNTTIEYEMRQLDNTIENEILNEKVL